MKVALKVYIFMCEQHWYELAGICHASYLCLEIPPPPPHSTTTTTTSNWCTFFSGVFPKKRAIINPAELFIQIPVTIILTNETQTIKEFWSLTEKFEKCSTQSLKCNFLSFFLGFVFIWYWIHLYFYWPGVFWWTVARIQILFPGKSFPVFLQAVWLFFQY